MARSASGALKPLHPRNRHREAYDFDRLIRVSPSLASFVHLNPSGMSSIDFADEVAVKALNRAILIADYGIRYWDIPAGYLCPPIPGRVDYLHYAADLLGRAASTSGPAIRVLDIGVGANCIYPILGIAEYGWSFVGVDVDPVALKSARLIADANPHVKKNLELRSGHSGLILQGVVRRDEKFSLSVCNPPFHSSLAEADAGTRRKWQNLQRDVGPQRRNFGGQAGELWCAGGEAAFVVQMIRESVAVGSQIGWFTSLVAKDASLSSILKAWKQLHRTQPSLRYRIIDMAQGQKKSRLVAWSFQEE